MRLSPLKNDLTWILRSILCYSDTKKSFSYSKKKKQKKKKKTRQDQTYKMDLDFWRNWEGKNSPIIE